VSEFEALYEIAIRLNPREFNVLTRRALGDTLRAIGRDQGVGPERIRQLESRALRNIRNLRRKSMFAYRDVPSYLCPQLAGAE
jgi:DNA-directed RNA polymerase sigma subunit (sigma70/sigma32)